MLVLGIDPGSCQSAYVVYDNETKKIVDKEILENKILLRHLRKTTPVQADFLAMQADYLAVEMIASYGFPVGKTTFDTCLWIGRFIEAWDFSDRPIPDKEDKKWNLVYRKSVNRENYCESVCMHLCHSARAKDTNIRQALIDRYEPSGGGRTPQIGIKARPGPLFGLTTDMWSALAVAITWDESHRTLF